MFDVKSVPLPAWAPCWPVYENPDYAKLFKLVRARIENRYGVYICPALAVVTQDNGFYYATEDAAKESIMQGIGEDYILDRWLAIQLETEIEYLGKEFMREYRLRWLDGIIEQLEGADHA